MKYIALALLLACSLIGQTPVITPIPGTSCTAAISYPYHYPGPTPLSPYGEVRWSSEPTAFFRLLVIDLDAPGGGGWVGWPLAPGCQLIPNLAYSIFVDIQNGAQEITLWYLPAVIGGTPWFKLQEIRLAYQAQYAYVGQAYDMYIH